MDLTPEVLELASRYHSEYSLAELIEAGKEAGISPELTEKAYLEVQRKRDRQRKKRQQISQISCALGFAIALWSCLTYNSLQSSLSEVKRARSQVENQIQRRAALLQNLADLHRYAEGESDRYALSQGGDRAVPGESGDPHQRNAPSNSDLNYEIIGTENRIAVERKRYLDRVRSYNNRVNRFPERIIAIIFGFSEVK